MSIRSFYGIEETRLFFFSRKKEPPKPGSPSESLFSFYFAEILFEVSYVGSVNGGNAGVNRLAAQVFAHLQLYNSVNSHLTHNVGVLSHEGQQLAALYMSDVGVGLIPAYAQNFGSVSGCVCNCCGCTVGSAVVGAVQSYNTVAIRVLASS